MTTHITTRIRRRLFARRSLIVWERWADRGLAIVIGASLAAILSRWL